MNYRLLIATVENLEVAFVQAEDGVATCIAHNDADDD